MISPTYVPWVISPSFLFICGNNSNDGHNTARMYMFNRVDAYLTRQPRSYEPHESAGTVTLFGVTTEVLAVVVILRMIELDYLLSRRGYRPVVASYHPADDRARLPLSARLPSKYSTPLRAAN